MKYIVYVICGLIPVLYGCKSHSFKEPGFLDYELKVEFYNHVKWYYRANLKYPSEEELCQFCWEIINDANDNRYSSFSDFEKADRKNFTGRENLLRYLSLYEKEFSFEKKNKAMDILWKGKKWMRIKLELCEMIKRKPALFTYFYSSGSSYSKDFDYEDCFYKMRKDIRDEYLTDSIEEGRIEPCLLRYDREKGYRMYYPLNRIMRENLYLNKLGCALDTFLLNRNIQMIQFVTNVPEYYLLKK